MSHNNNLKHKVMYGMLNKSLVYSLDFILIKFISTIHFVFTNHYFITYKVRDTQIINSTNDYILH